MLPICRPTHRVSKNIYYYSMGLPLYHGSGLNYILAEKRGVSLNLFKTNENANKGGGGHTPATPYGYAGSATGINECQQ